MNRTAVFSQLNAAMPLVSDSLQFLFAAPFTASAHYPIRFPFTPSERALMTTWAATMRRRGIRLDAHDGFATDTGEEVILVEDRWRDALGLSICKRRTGEILVEVCGGWDRTLDANTFESIGAALAFLTAIMDAEDVEGTEA